MDSLTQAALGASVAYGLWHKPLGRKSLLWGGALGTLPDLDILAYPFLDGVERLYWHRGESHSIWVIFFGSLIFSFFAHRRWWQEKMLFRHIFLGLVAIFGTHVLIDYFTIYGTQLLAPFSRYGFAHGNFFIIDPLYTLPLLFGIVFAVFLKNPKPNLIGLYISSFYALYSLGAHGYAHHIFTQDLKNKGLHVNASITMATPFNTLLWRHLVQTSDGLKVGYYSLLAPKAIEYEHIEQNKELIEPFKDGANVKAIEWFSKGFWVAQKKDDTIRMNDVRFGEIKSTFDAPSHTWHYLFSWIITHEERELQRAPRSEGNVKESLHILYQKLIGT